jgi:hypothetical protein
VRLLPAKQETTVSTVKQLLSAEEESGEIKISQPSKRPACPRSRLLHCAGRSTFKRLILSTPLSLAFVRIMSLPSDQELKDCECERGKVTHRPPIAYAQYRYKKYLVELDKLKIKLLGGDTFLVELMGDASNAETYMKWYFNYLRIIVERKSGVKVQACADVLKSTFEDLKKPSRIPKRETDDQKAERELELAARNAKYNVTYSKHADAIGVHYDLFRQLLADEPQVQWDCIVEDVHNKDPWTGLNGVTTSLVTTEKIVPNEFLTSF